MSLISFQEQILIRIIKNGLLQFTRPLITFSPRRHIVCRILVLLQGIGLFVWNSFADDGAESGYGLILLIGDVCHNSQRVSMTLLLCSLSLSLGCLGFVLSLSGLGLE